MSNDPLYAMQDVMGAAETGSGKTLAYGLPVLDALLKRRDQGGPDMTRGPLAALVLCPTRELAMQVGTYLPTVIHKRGDHMYDGDALSLLLVVVN